MNIFIRITLTLAGFLITVNSHACDICGCGAGTSYLGMMPEYNNNIVGLRYRNNSMFTHLGPSKEHTYLTTDERFNNVEAWAALKLHNNFRGMIQLPYSIISKKNIADNSIETKSGIGDAQLIAQYHLLNKKSNLGNKLLVLDAWLGGGMKIPTGKYQFHKQINTINLFQLGTGSWDIITQGAFDIRLQDIGININALYKINTTNNIGYYYGNKLAVNTQFYYKISIGKDKNLVPNMGISYEHNRRDQNNNVVLDATGGSITKLSIGIELKLVNFFWGVQYQPVLNQRIGLDQIQIKDNFATHFGVNL